LVGSNAQGKGGAPPPAGASPSRPRGSSGRLVHSPELLAAGVGRPCSARGVYWPSIEHARGPPRPAAPRSARHARARSAAGWAARRWPARRRRWLLAVSPAPPLARRRPATPLPGWLAGGNSGQQRQRGDEERGM
jgi:hypothetical protein